VTLQQAKLFCERNRPDRIYRKRAVFFRKKKEVGKEEKSRSCNVVAFYDFGDQKERIARTGKALRATSYTGTSKAS
jgi:hypothetical protein